ncbi:hypothetical protein R3P38DRAFT_3171012 [Favolaschia claudopus]|uniref:Uncharacterized protein n=1 Tax=Favolaschia claudopus TaxID=2862362 RepID=A0AAW0DP99_9AGAR
MLQEEDENEDWDPCCVDLRMGRYSATFRFATTLKERRNRRDEDERKETPLSGTLSTVVRSYSGRRPCDRQTALPRPPSPPSLGPAAHDAPARIPRVSHHTHPSSQRMRVVSVARSCRRLATLRVLAALEVFAAGVSDYDSCGGQNRYWYRPPLSLQHLPQSLESRLPPPPSPDYGSPATSLPHPYRICIIYSCHRASPQPGRGKMEGMGSIRRELSLTCRGAVPQLDEQVRDVDGPGKEREDNMHAPQNRQTLGRCGRGLQRGTPLERDTSRRDDGGGRGRTPGAMWMLQEEEEEKNWDPYCVVRST